MQHRQTTAANGTQFLNVQPSVTACQCNDALTCTMEERHVGESIRICLWSQFLNITAVTNLTLHANDGVSYQAVTDGIVNELTQLYFEGRLAVVTTMVISAFFHHANPSDLLVDATVSFSPLHNQGRRHLAADTSTTLFDRPTRVLLTRPVNNTVVILCWVVLSIAIVIFCSTTCWLAWDQKLCCFTASRSRQQEYGDTDDETYIKSIQ